MSAEPVGIEKRASPRFRTNLPGRLCGTHVSIRNVSPTGAQVACAAVFFDFLEPRLSSPRGRAPAGFELSLEDRKLLVACDVMYVNDYGDEMLVGLRFVQDNSRDLLALETYVASLAGTTNPIA